MLTVQFIATAIICGLSALPEDDPPVWRVAMALNAALFLATAIYLILA